MRTISNVLILWIQAPSWAALQVSSHSYPFVNVFRSSAPWTQAIYWARRSQQYHWAFRRSLTKRTLDEVGGTGSRNAEANFQAQNEIVLPSELKLHIELKLNTLAKVMLNYAAFGYRYQFRRDSDEKTFVCGLSCLHLLTLIYCFQCKKSRLCMENHWL